MLVNLQEEEHAGRSQSCKSQSRRLSEHYTSPKRYVPHASACSTGDISKTALIFYLISSASSEKVHALCRWQEWALDGGHSASAQTLECRLLTPQGMHTTNTVDLDKPFLSNKRGSVHRGCHDTMARGMPSQSRIRAKYQTWAKTLASL
jgi:hypothetical protein